jgi:lipopolysaccharide transport system ATP-binding protein
MDERFDAIAAFADIGEFIDLPVRTYSSGMFIRLAFAAAIHTDPEIVVIDEALAVGDAAFQRKCFDRLYQLQEQGATLVVVSHDPYQIERLCDWVAIADRGTISPLAPAGEALERYRGLLYQGASARTHGEQREGTQELYFDTVTVEGEREGMDTAFRSMRPLLIVASLISRVPKSDVRIRFEICSSDNAIVAMVTTIGLTEAATFEGRYVITFAMPCCQLTSGWYYVNAVAVDRNIRLDTWRRAAEFRVVLDDDAFRLSSDAGTYVCQGTWTIE